MTEHHIIEPVGACPITGYPLLAVNDANGTHAGLALAYLADVEHLHAQTRHDSADPDACAGSDITPPLRLEAVATASEILRSWVEVLLFALTERIETHPDRADADLRTCEDLLHARHHYDTARIIAAVHITATEHLRIHAPWDRSPLVLIPDVGVVNVRTAAQTAVRRLTPNHSSLETTVNRLRQRHLQQLARA